MHPIMPAQQDMSPLEQQAADALRRARRLPIGASRNDLRQLAMGLLWLHRNGMRALEQARADKITSWEETSRG
jgi:hypothetical protein